MDNSTLAKLIGLGIVVVIFVVTIVLMPRIFGAKRPPEATGTPEDPERPQRSGELPKG